MRLQEVVQTGARIIVIEDEAKVLAAMAIRTTLLLPRQAIVLDRTIDLPARFAIEGDILLYNATTTSTTHIRAHRVPPFTMLNLLMLSQITQPDNSWYPDSGATHHFTGDVNNLGDRLPYHGAEQVTLGNGTTSPILYRGSSPLFSFKLNNVLYSPLIVKNLVSVSQFTKDTNSFFEFHPYYFYVKDRQTGQVLHKGQSKHGLYAFDTAAAAPVCLLAETSKFQLWHRRLGHPSPPVLQRVVVSSSLSSSKIKVPTSVCTSCQMARVGPFHSIRNQFLPLCLFN